MGRYGGAVKAELRRRIGPPRRQSVRQLFAELSIDVDNLYNRQG